MGEAVNVREALEEAVAKAIEPCIPSGFYAHGIDSYTRDLSAKRSARAALDALVALRVPGEQRCATCAGSGKIKLWPGTTNPHTGLPMHEEVCSDCDGSGRVLVPALAVLCIEEGQMEQVEVFATGRDGLDAQAIFRGRTSYPQLDAIPDEIVERAAREVDPVCFLYGGDVSLAMQENARKVARRVLAAAMTSPKCETCGGTQQVTDRRINGWWEEYPTPQMPCPDCPSEGSPPKEERTDG